jgi:hypothetical protein
LKTGFYLRKIFTRCLSLTNKNFGKQLGKASGRGLEKGFGETKTKAEGNRRRKGVKNELKKALISPNRMEE